MRKLLLIFCLFVQLSWALDRQPSADYHARRQALANKIKNGVVLLFAPNEAEGPNDLYGYRPDDNFFYLSGWPEPGAALLIATSPEHPSTEILFLPDHNPSQENWTGPKLGPENPDAAKITGIDRVVAMDNLRSELIRLLPGPKASVYTDIPEGKQVSNSTAALDWLKRANSFPV
ncbi:MAG TPA: aminopeptidase P N-terminal domain-containing protein, partial [Terriglobales bacterium]|nr:aminopeptidase P N-terminal domain-containing protein [Terriglobales bacterium]